MTPFELWTLCQSCAESVYGRTAPTPEYADRAARLLFGTWAVEDPKLARRQYGFGSYPPNKRGGFGLWQCELATLMWMMDVLRQRSDILHHLYKWLGPGHLLEPQNAGKILIQLQTPAGDRLACALARVRYFKAPGAIPATVEEQAEYWFRWYNGGWDCNQGAGLELAKTYGVDTARGIVLRKYVSAWNARCAPVVAPVKPAA